MVILTLKTAALNRSAEDMLNYFADNAAKTFFFFQSTVCPQFVPGLSSGVSCFQPRIK